MQPVLTSELMRRIDKAAIEGLGLPGVSLMETAGRAVVSEIAEFELACDCVRPLLLCGRGNNGGDGFVVARYLIERSAQGWPLVFLAGRLDELKGDAAVMAGVALGCGIRVVELDGSDYGELEQALEEADLIVDALLGTGAAGAPGGTIGRMLELVLAHTHPVVSIDCPTGVQMDDGQLPGAAIMADLTVTFGYPKIGHLIQPGASFCGEIQIADIGFPRAAEKGLEFDVFVTEAVDVGFNFGPRDPDTNKGDYGKLLVVGGSTGLTGAAVMACESAMAVGAGMVTAAVPSSLNVVFETKLTETMTRSFEDRGRGAFGPEAINAVLETLKSGMDVLALGPGLGRAEETRDFVLSLTAGIPCPAVIDADGLNAFESRPELLSRSGAPLVITPHPGEMSRLTGFSTAEIKSRPIQVAREFAKKHGLVVLLKGCPTVIADSSGRVMLNPTGGPQLAKAGSGDILTGVIAGLLAQGFEPFQAAYCGAYLHGLAGDIAARELGEYCVNATDLIASLPAAIRAVESEVYGEDRDRSGLL